MVVRRASAAAASRCADFPAPFMQESLVVYVDVIKCVRSIERTLDGAKWPLERISTLGIDFASRYGVRSARAVASELSM